MSADTPRTNALLTELRVVKLTTFRHIVSLTQRHVDFTRAMERENNLLRQQIKARQLLEDAARKAVRVRGNGQSGQLDDAVLLIEVALAECDRERDANDIA